MLIDPLADIPESLTGGVVAIGNFEGVHRGHCRLLARLRDRARQIQAPAVAVSFDPHPLLLLRPESAPEPLLWTERKEKILVASGANYVAILRTTREFLNLSPDEFFQRIVLRGFRAKGMVEGRNFGFGRGRAGNIELLARQCQSADIPLDVVDIITGEGESEVSSTRIRRELAQGRIDVADQLLGRPYRVLGTVSPGDRRGATLGFPTANLTEIPVMIPKEGVYAGRIKIDGRTLAAACNIGPNPTFQVDSRKFEVHILDYSGDLYGRRIEVDLIERIRDVRAFSGIDDLKEQLARDVDRCRTINKNYMHPFGRDLGQTITQWVDGEIGPSLAALRGQVRKAVLELDGRLTIHLDAPPNLPPHETLGLLGRLDGRLTAVFPEVSSVLWRSIDDRSPD